MNRLPTHKQFKIQLLHTRQQALTTLSSPHPPMSNKRMTRIQNHIVHIIKILSKPNLLFRRVTHLLLHGWRNP